MALTVSPVTLLMPQIARHEEWDEPVKVTAYPKGVKARRLWSWLVCRRPWYDTVYDLEVFKWLAGAVPGPYYEELAAPYKVEFIRGDD